MYSVIYFLLAEFVTYIYKKLFQLLAFWWRFALDPNGVHASSTCFLLIVTSRSRDSLAKTVTNEYLVECMLSTVFRI